MYGFIIHIIICNAPQQMIYIHLLACFQCDIGCHATPLKICRLIYELANRLGVPVENKKNDCVIIANLNSEQTKISKRTFKNDKMSTRNCVTRHIHVVLRIIYYICMYILIYVYNICWPRHLLPHAVASFRFPQINLSCTHADTRKEGNDK